MTLVTDLADLFDATLVAQPVSTDEFGDYVASGDSTSLSCRLEGQERVVRTSDGREVASSVTVIVAAATPVLTVNGYRYSLPASHGYDPRVELAAIAVMRHDDEGGPLYQEVLLP